MKVLRLEIGVKGVYLARPKIKIVYTDIMAVKNRVDASE